MAFAIRLPPSTKDDEEEKLLVRNIFALHTAHFMAHEDARK